MSFFLKGVLFDGLRALLSDESFKISTSTASSTRATAEALSSWIPQHLEESTTFEKKITDMLQTCLQSSGSQKMQREKMWASYHLLRTSDDYIAEWCTFLQSSGHDMSPMMCQYLGHHMFKQFIKLHHPIQQSHETTSHPVLTYEETNAVRYAAGYIPRALQKKLPKSTHPLKEDLQLCLLDLLDDGDEDDDASTDWLDLVNRGGLTKVNNMTYELFLAMELELRRHLATAQPTVLGDQVKQAIAKNEDVEFLWSMIGADWDGESSSVLLEMVVSQWVKIRGFSYASAWIEKYKVAQKTTTQKSKGVRKQLLPQPKKAKRDSAKD